MISLRYICLLVAVIRLSAAQICSPDNNEYYHPQAGMCFKCDSCLVGAGKDTLNGNDKVEWDTEHGALTCVPCKPCPVGYFNDRRGFVCKPCNDCSQQNRHELKPCTHKSDVQCGSLIQVPEHTSLGLTRTTPTETEDNSAANMMQDAPNLLTLYILGITLGVCTVILLSVVLFICWRKQNAKQEQSAMNNCIEAHELLQKGMPIVVVENANNETKDAKISKGTINNYNKAYTTDSLSSHGNSSRSSLEERPLVEGETETTPKVIALTTDNSTVDCTNVPSTSYTKQTNLVCNKCRNLGKIKCNNNLQCCNRNTLCTMSNLSKSSLNSDCSELLLTNTLLHGNIGNTNKNISVLDVEGCLLKRSKCSIDNMSHEILTDQGFISIQNEEA